MLWYLSCNEQQKLLCMDIGAGLSEASLEFCWGEKQRKKKRTATTSKFLFYIINKCVERYLLHEVLACCEVRLHSLFAQLLVYFNENAI